MDLGRTVRFVSLEEGQSLLRERDAFVRRLGAFERAVRMGRDGEATEEEFLAHVAGCACAWPPDRLVHVQAALARVSGRLSRFAHLLPEEIGFVYTDGREEAGSGYTRGTAIFLPPGKAGYPVERLERFLVHECFHLLTRRNPGLRDQLYALLGFRPCGEVQLPERYERWRLTNPDAPHQEHAFSLAMDDGRITLLPVLHWKEPRFLPGRYFDHVVLSLLPIQKGAERWGVISGEPWAKAPVEAHFEALGLPFDQPEEMLAERFVRVVLDHPSTLDPWTRVLEQMMTTHGTR